MRLTDDANSVSTVPHAYTSRQFSKKDCCSMSHFHLVLPFMKIFFNTLFFGNDLKNSHVDSLHVWPFLRVCIVILEVISLAFVFTSNLATHHLRNFSAYEPCFFFYLTVLIYFTSFGIICSFCILLWRCIFS